MSKYINIEKQVEKKYSQKEKRKRKRMHQSGKSVFKLKELIKKRHASLPKRTSNKKNK